VKIKNYSEKMAALEVYIEHLKHGIRDICLPNYGGWKRELNYIDVEAKKNGFGTLLITYDRICNDGKRHITYQRIIYRKNRRADACLLREQMERIPKTIHDHRIIGRLLGYSKEAIDSFVNDVRKTGGGRMVVSKVGKRLNNTKC